MRKIRRLALFTLLALSTFLTGVFISRLRTTPTLSQRQLSAWQVLLSFDNQDLEGLNEQSKHVVRKAIDELVPRKEGDRFPPFEPRLFRTIANAKGAQRYILVEEAQPFATPGESILQVHIFDNAGNLLNKQEFSTGWRAAITAIKIRSLDTIKQPTLIVQGEYYFGGKPFYQYYALSGDQIVMVYNVTDYGFDRINYWMSNAQIGPMIQRSADEWEEALESSDNIEILSALMWLSGPHSNIDPAGPKEAYSEERKFLMVRGRPSVQKRLVQLSESDNFWIKSAASSITVPYD